jgi:folate-binding Fe-S cluster repair protein YgfZ
MENGDTNNDTLQTLQCYAVTSGIQLLTDTMQNTVVICLEDVKTARRHIKQEILSQSNAKEQYQYDLTSDIIDHILTPSQLRVPF